MLDLVFGVGGVLTLLLGLIVIFLFKKSFGETKKTKEPDDTVDRDENSKHVLADDACLKRGFSKRAISDLLVYGEELDAIVIGSGIGGLTCAALMAKAGKRVLVLEQHDQAGGCTHRFVEKTKDETTGEVHEYEFDTGLHYVGKMSKGTDHRRLMDYITNDKLKWQKMEEDFEIAVNSKTKQKIAVPSSATKYKEHLKTAFPSPSDQAAIDEYFVLLRKVDKQIARHFTVSFLPAFLQKLFFFTPTPPKSRFARLFRPLAKKIDGEYHAYASRTTADVLSEFVKNPDLLGVLTYQWGDVGLPPSKSSIIHHVMVATHYMAGGYYPVGGTSQLAACIIPVIEQHNGAVLVRACVDEIMFEGITAIGVRVKDTRIFSKVVVSAVGALTTYCDLIPENLRGPLGPFAAVYDTFESSGVEPSPSLLSVFIGLKGSQKELQLPAQNTWLFPSWDHDSNFEHSPNDCAYFISYPSAKDPTWDSRFGNSSVALVITPAEYSLFESWADKRIKHRGDEYMQEKKKFQDRCVEVLCQQMPHLRDCIDYVDTGTPLSNNFYLGTKFGEAYGLSGTPKRWSQYNHLFGIRSGANRFVLCGQDSFSPGIAGALTGGLFSACAAFPSIIPTAAQFL